MLHFVTSITCDLGLGSVFFFYDCEGKMSMFSIGRPLPIHLVVHPLVNSFEQAPLHFWYRKNIHQIIWLHIHSLVTYFKWVPLFCSQPWSFCWGWFAELYCLRYCGKLVYGNYLWFLKLELAGMCPSTAERSFILQANREKEDDCCLQVLSLVTPQFYGELRVTAFLAFVTVER